MQYNQIMLIDDDADDQEIFLTALEVAAPALACSIVDDGCDALDLLVRRQLTPDLIFLDLNMPIMNGQQFLREIKSKETLKYIPVIIFSTSSNPETVAELMRLGAHDFITKPDKFDQLTTILGTLFQA